METVCKISERSLNGHSIVQTSFLCLIEPAKIQSRKYIQKQTEIIKVRTMDTFEKELEKFAGKIKKLVLTFVYLSLNDGMPAFHPLWWIDKKKWKLSKFKSCKTKSY